MNEKYDQETAVRLIANTRRKKRPDSIVEIAGYIRELESDVGSLKAVSEIPGIDISAHMLRQFLSVEQLYPEVKKLVAERKIDLINVVHYMRNFDEEAQKTDVNPKNWTDPLASIIIWKKSRIGGYHVR